MASLLAIDAAGLKLENPTMLAAGILGISGAFMKRVAEAGAGAVVTKSIGREPREGYPNPTVTQVDGGVVNAIGLANPGINYFGVEISKMEDVTVPIVASVYGFSSRDYADVAEKAAQAGADAVELNLSCPHVERTGTEIGQFPQLVAEVVNKVKPRVDIPVFVKLTPNVADLVEIAKAAAEAGADGITAVNTVRAMTINIETAQPVLSNRIGGLSGSAIKPIAVRCVYEISREIDVPVIGCGGVATWQDAVEFMLAGASAVQIGTAIAFQGLEVFESITKGLSGYLKERRLSSAREIVGLSHRD
jgi:dihydroorotate dehydrogenase (NAD+) catalytic subunit